jgi:hypothetical protein
MIVTHIPRDDNTVQKNAGKKCTGCHHYIIQMFFRKGNKKADFKIANNAYKQFLKGFHLEFFNFTEIFNCQLNTSPILALNLLGVSL